MPKQAKELLHWGMNELGLNPDEQILERQIKYLLLLQKWNERINLTAIEELDAMVQLHLLDSLSISPFLDGETILDLGSGAGLPGIPLALQHPGKKFLLLDSSSKKARFLRQVKISLGLENVSIENCRIEHYASTERIDIVLCRAFSGLGDILNKSGHVLGKGCKLLAMKGRYPEKELADMPAGFQVEEVTRLQVPGLESERHLLRISRQE